MSLTSFVFVMIFIILLGVYYIIPARCQWIALLVFSILFFICSCKVWTIIYAAASVISTRIVCSLIHTHRKDWEGKKLRRTLIAGLVINLGILCLLKYLDFVIFNVNGILALFGAGVVIPFTEWAAPIGISFYTLQIVAYMLDVYWGITEPEEGLLRTGLFIGFWPQLVSGPIVRHNEVKDQLFSGHSFSWKNVTFGLQRMMWGIFKSLVISNRLGKMVDTIYADTVRYNGFYIWFAAAAFLLQLYTDFSGCMDIVIGASECYGIVLPENFRTPLFSGSVQEYWQRWHITLGAFMRDYVMTPVLRTDLWRRMTKAVKGRFGKKAAVQIPSDLGMLVVWLLMGIWHGGGWKYILGMGIWFWLCIALGRLFEPVFRKMTELLHIDTDAFSWHLFRSLRVFILASIGNMFFRIASLSEAIEAIKQGFSRWNPWILFDGSLYSLGITEKEFRLTAAGLILLLAVSAIQQTKGSVRELIAKQNYVFRWLVYLALVSAIVVYGAYGPGYEAQQFIYAGF